MGRPRSDRPVVVPGRLIVLVNDDDNAVGRCVHAQGLQGSAAQRPELVTDVGGKHQGHSRRERDQVILPSIHASPAPSRIMRASI